MDLTGNCYVNKGLRDRLGGWFTMRLAGSQELDHFDMKSTFTPYRSNGQSKHAVLFLNPTHMVRAPKPCAPCMCKHHKRCIT